MFSVHGVSICMNLKYLQIRMDYMYYCITELAVIIFGFITISFTSYNLDIYAKQTIGLVGISLVMFVFILAVGVRIYELVKHYKESRRLKEDELKRNTTQNNIMRDQDVSALEDVSEPSPDIRKDSFRNFDNDASVQENDVKQFELPKMRKGQVPEEEYKF